MDGWIKLHKKIWLSDFANKPFGMVIWLWLLTHAKDDGTVRCGRAQIARETGVKQPTVQYWLKRFQNPITELSTNYQLTIIQTNNRFTVFQICNWSKYQSQPISKPTRVLSESVGKTITNKNKKKNINISTNVDIREIDLNSRQLFFELSGLLGFSELVKFTDQRRRKLAARLKTYTAEELRLAAKAIANDGFMQGDNPGGKRYGTIDYLIRSDENLEKWLDRTKQTIPEDLTKFEIVV